MTFIKFLVVAILLFLISKDAHCQSNTKKFDLIVVINDSICQMAALIQIVRYFGHTRELITGTYVPGLFITQLDAFNRINSTSTDSVFIEVIIPDITTEKGIIYRLEYNKEWTSDTYNILYIYDKDNVKYRVCTNRINSHLIYVN